MIRLGRFLYHWTATFKIVGAEQKFAPFGLAATIMRLFLGHVMSRENTERLFILLIMMSVLIACTARDEIQASPSTETNISQATEALSDTPGSRLDVTVTQEVTSTSPVASPSPTLSSTPDFRATSVGQNGFLLSSSDDPTCQLPCWQGLRIGVSTQADIETTFHDVFNTNNSPIGLFENNPWSHNSLSVFNLEGMNEAGYAWWMPDGNGHFEFDAVVDEQSDLLLALGFTILIPETLQTNFHTRTVKEILMTLGAPEHAFGSAK